MSLPKNKKIFIPKESPEVGFVPGMNGSYGDPVSLFGSALQTDVPNFDTYPGPAIWNRPAPNAACEHPANFICDLCVDDKFPKTAPNRKGITHPATADGVTYPLDPAQPSADNDPVIHCNRFVPEAYEGAAGSSVTPALPELWTSLQDVAHKLNAIERL
jgi:hypothetical protein